MKNFIYSNPTRIIFGRGVISDVHKYLPSDGKILMIYGQGSIKNNGVYTQVKKALEDYSIEEFGGIEPNPRYETCLKVLDIIRKANIDYLLAVGGGSVLDAAKFIALASFYTASNDPWDFMIGRHPGPAGALPIGCIMTVPASGSEMNCNLVISREETHEKLGYSAYAAYPKFSILDPETTYSLSMRQTANGIVDSFVHVLEQYITFPSHAPLQDRQAEALLTTIIEETPRVMSEPTNYDVRATLMWCATQALNGTINRGMPQDWATHIIGQEITAFYGLDHAATLAIILIGLWENQFESKKMKLAQFGRRVWNLDGNDDTVAKDALTMTETFFKTLQIPTRFSEYDLNSHEVADKITRRLLERPFVSLGERRTIGIEDIKMIIISRE